MHLAGLLEVTTAKEITDTSSLEALTKSKGAKPLQNLGWALNSNAKVPASVILELTQAWNRLSKKRRLNIVCDASGSIGT